MTDFEAEGLLEGVSGKARDDRLELLGRLADQGVALDELRRAVEEGRLALLPVERFFVEGVPARYTEAEIAEGAGVELELLRRQFRALGLTRGDSDERAFTEDDLDAAKRIRAMLDAGLPEDRIEEGARVMGMAMSQLAATNIAMVGEAMLRPGDTELEAADRYLDASQTLGPLIGPAIQHAFGRHFIEQFRRVAVSREQLERGSVEGWQEVSACFADLVGFTRLGEQLEVDQLGALTVRLGELAGEVASAPVRLVKLIGDAAMLVSPDNDALLDAALDLVAAADDAGDDFPPLHAGVARGPALPRSGDWYGRAVNLASRLTSFAYPGSILCAEPVHDAAGDGYRWSFAGERRVKGFDERMKLFRCRRADEADPSGDEAESSSG